MRDGCLHRRGRCGTGVEGGTLVDGEVGAEAVAVAEKETEKRY
jgi:hypothetical protein